jgi:hypothetical protein
MNPRHLTFPSLLLLIAFTAGAENPNIQCARCHQKIYDSYQAATMALRHLLEFSPDDGKARRMLASIESNANSCGH